MGPDHEKVIDVRRVLETNAVSTSLQDLKRQGRDRVRVINANQISALIEEAVARAIEAHESATAENRQEIVERSQEEFRTLVKERQREAAEMQGLRDECESLRTELAAREAEPGASQRDLDEAKALAEQERIRSSELRERVEDLKHVVETLRAENERIRSREVEGGGSGNPALEAQLMATLMTEIQNLKQDLSREVRPAATADVSEQMSAIADAVNDKLEKFGRKIGVSSAIDAGEVSFAGLFNDQTELKSNMDDLAVKERKGESIQDTLAKMRAMQKGQ